MTTLHVRSGGDGGGGGAGGSFYVRVPSYGGHLPKVAFSDAPAAQDIDLRNARFVPSAEAISLIERDSLVGAWFEDPSFPVVLEPNVWPRWFERLCDWLVEAA